MSFWNFQEKSRQMRSQGGNWSIINRAISINFQSLEWRTSSCSWGLCAISMDFPTSLPRTRVWLLVNIFMHAKRILTNTKSTITPYLQSWDQLPQVGPLPKADLLKYSGSYIALHWAMWEIHIELSILSVQNSKNSRLEYFHSIMQPFNMISHLRMASPWISWYFWNTSTSHYSTYLCLQCLQVPNSYPCCYIASKRWNDSSSIHSVKKRRG